MHRILLVKAPMKFIEQQLMFEIRLMDRTTIFHISNLIEQDQQDRQPHLCLLEI